MPKPFLVGLALILLASPAVAQSRVTFAWDAGSGAEGYSFEIGPSPGSTTSQQNVGQTLTAAIDFQPGVYYVRVRSYNSTGFSVDTSNELTVAVPTQDPCTFTDWALQSVTPWSTCVNSLQTRTETWVRSILTGGSTCGPTSESRLGQQACTVPPPACDPPIVTVWPTQKKRKADLRYTSTWTVTSFTLNGRGQTIDSATFTGSGCNVTVPKP